MLTAEFWNGAFGAAIVTGVFGIILAIIGWIRGARPDARAEMDLALQQQRATIDRLTSTNTTLEAVIDQLRKDKQADSQRIAALETEKVRNDIYMIRLEEYIRDRQGDLEEHHVPFPPKPARPRGTGASTGNASAQTAG